MKLRKLIIETSLFLSLTLSILSSLPQTLFLIPQVEAQNKNNISFQPNMIPFLSILPRMGRNNESFQFAWLNNTFDLEIFFNATLERQDVNITRLWSLRDFEDDFDVIVQFPIVRNESSARFGWVIDNVTSISDRVHSAWLKIEGSSFDYEKIEVEEIDSFRDLGYNITRYHLPDNLDLEFSDLYDKGFAIGWQNKTVTEVKGFSGKSSWNLDPIVYSTNYITATGGSASDPIIMRDIYDADKGGTYEFLSRFKFGTDASWVTVTGKMRPADYVILGGASNDLWVSVTTGSGWNKVLGIRGTDRDGTTIYENITITGLGTYYSTLWYKSITGTRVYTSPSGSMTYKLRQGQWGVISNPNSFGGYNSSSWISYAEIFVGDGTTETYFQAKNEQITFRENSDVGALAYGFEINYATVTFGQLDNSDVKATSNGVSIFANSTSGIQLLNIEGGSTVNIYSSQFAEISNVIGTTVGIGSTDTTKIYNSEFWNIAYILLKGVMDIYNVRAQRASSRNFDLGSGTFTINGLYAMNSTGDLFILTPSSDATVKGFYGRKASSSTFSGVGPYADVYLVNPDVDAWTFEWVGNYKVYRQYEFDLIITNKDGVAINGATVTLKDKNENTIFTTTTDANGQITTQTISRGWYAQATGNTLNDNSPHNLKIEKSGYQTYEIDFTLTKTDWRIALIVDVPPTTPGGAGSPPDSGQTAPPEEPKFPEELQVVYVPKELTVQDMALPFTVGVIASVVVISFSYTEKKRRKNRKNVDRFGARKRNPWEP